MNQHHNQQPGFSSPKEVNAVGIRLAKTSIPLIGLTLEVFLRHNFGKRYIYSQMEFGIFLIFPLFMIQRPIPYLIFLVCALVMSLAHRLMNWLSYATGTRLREYRAPNAENLYLEDSPYYPGTSWRFWGWIGLTDQYTIQLYAEPLLSILLGVALLTFNGGLGGWVIIAGICMFLNGQMGKASYKRLIDDAIHQHIMGGGINRDVSGNQNTKAGGDGRAHPVRPNIRNVKR